MKINGTEDLRIQKSVQIIRKTFEKMIVKMDYEQMDVKMLCDEAMINIKTFYRYYDSLASLLMEFQEEMADEFIEILNKYKIPEELDKVNRDYISSLSLKGLAYQKIMMTGNFGYINFKTMERVLNEMNISSDHNNDIDLFKRNVLINFLNTTSLDVYRRWVDDGKKIPLKDVIELSSKLIINGSSAILKKED